MHKQWLKAFTLIELIVVMGILAILATIVVIAVNPGRQFAASRNAKRMSDVRAIANAINQHAADNNGQVYASITSTPQTIGTANLNLSSILVPNYLSAIPMDPSSGTVADTKYQVYLHSITNKIVVKATVVELDQLVNSEGVRNYALQLDDNNDTVSVNDANSLDLTTGFTIEAWVKQRAISNSDYILDKNNNNYYLVLYANGSISAGVNSAASAITTATGILPTYLNQWVHIAATFNGNNSQIFVNGISQVTGTLASVTPNANPLTLGSYSSGAHSFAGQLDEVRISNTVRYTSTFTPSRRFTPDANTVGLWHFDEGDGTFTADSSGNGNNGTLTNGPEWIVGQ